MVVYGPKGSDNMYDKINESERRKKLVKELTDVKTEVYQRRAKAQAKAKAKEDKIHKYHLDKDAAYIKKHTEPSKIEKHTLKVFDFMTKMLVQHAKENNYSANLAYKRCFDGYTGEVRFGNNIFSLTREISDGKAITGPSGYCFSLSRLQELCDETGINIKQDSNAHVFVFSCSEIINEIMEKQKVLSL